MSRSKTYRADAKIIAASFWWVFCACGAGPLRDRRLRSVGIGCPRFSTSHIFNEHKLLFRTQEAFQPFTRRLRYFNLGMAIKYACGTWLLMVVVLVARSGITGLGGSCLLLPCLVYLPMIVLLLVFLLGHQIVGETPSLWVDKLCIHQTDPDLKAEQIAALAVFVARSQRMLILWDDTYFERLWCNLELATHARFCGAEKVEVLPLWLAPWLLASILLDILGVTLFFQLEPVFPKWSEAVTRYAAAMLGETRGGSYFVACFAVWLMSSIVYLPISIPCFFSFRMKLRSHQLMLNQMAAFDVKNAKCSLPADREPITQHVRELFRDRDGREEDAKVTGDVDAGEAGSFV